MLKVARTPWCSKILRFAQDDEKKASHHGAGLFALVRKAGITVVDKVVQGLLRSVNFLAHEIVDHRGRAPSHKAGLGIDDAMLMAAEV